jgi:hypothetical protein
VAPHASDPTGHSPESVADEVLDWPHVQVQIEGMPPDNTGPPRSLVDEDERPTLGVRATMAAIEELAKARGIVGARVAYKRNARGEHVVAIIWPA